MNDPELNRQLAVTIIQRAIENKTRLDMSAWQQFKAEGCCQTEKELNDCGMAACFGGLIAISPEWLGQGHTISSRGAPIYIDHKNRETKGSYAIREWLGLSSKDAVNLCAMERSTDKKGDIYGSKQTSEITLADVVRVSLYLEKEGHLDNFIEIKTED